MGLALLFLLLFKVTVLFLFDLILSSATCNRFTSSHLIHVTGRVHERVCVCVLFYGTYHIVCWPCMFTTPLCMCPCVCVPYRKTITIRILDREEYNKQSSFYVLLGEPEWRRNKKERTGVTANQMRMCLVELLVNPKSTRCSWKIMSRELSFRSKTLIHKCIYDIITWLVMVKTRTYFEFYTFS